MKKILSHVRNTQERKTIIPNNQVSMHYYYYYYHIHSEIKTYKKLVKKLQ